MKSHYLFQVWKRRPQKIHLSTGSVSRSHNCDESQGDGEVKLACGCMLPVVAGTLSHEGERKLKYICAGKTPCGV